MGLNLSMTKITLPIPTPDLIRRSCESFDLADDYTHTAVQSLFEAFPTNRTFPEVLLKVSALNALYKTQIWDIYPVAHHICEGIRNLDQCLLSGQAEIVDQISRVTNASKIRRNYSFATKFCHFQNPSAYPIYDRYVSEALWQYSKQHQFASFKRFELEDYVEFLRVMGAFKTSFKLTRFGWRDLDKFLWICGRDLLT